MRTFCPPKTIGRGSETLLQVGTKLMRPLLHLSLVYTLMVIKIRFNYKIFLFVCIFKDYYVDITYISTFFVR